MQVQQQHSKMFKSTSFQEFFTILQQIAPQYLTWSEAGGSLFCLQKKVDPAANINTLNTVAKVFAKLHLTIEPDQHHTKENPNGDVVYVFTLRGIQDQLNRKPWTKRHLADYANSSKKSAKKTDSNKTSKP